MQGMPQPKRVVTHHKIDGIDSRLRIEVLDEPGAGNACHQYVVCEDTTGESALPRYIIKFQKGPVIEAGLNGLTNETLLAIVQDRLEGFQSGDFACGENQVALDHVREALDVLKARTADRLHRGVEGKSEK